MRFRVSVTVLPASRSPLPLLIPVPDPTTDDMVGVPGIDLRAALGQAGERQVGSVAGPIGDAGGVQIDRGGGEGGGVLSRTDGVVEGQCAGAGTADIGGGAAVVERQRRGAAER